MVKERERENAFEASLLLRLTASASTSHTKISPCSLATASSGSTGWNETALTLLPEGRNADGRRRIVRRVLDGRESSKSREKNERKGMSNIKKPIHHSHL